MAELAHLDPERKLGSLGAFTPEERLEFYQNRICVPTPTDNAGNLERTRFAQLFVSLESPDRVLDVGSHDAFVTRNLVKNNDCISHAICIDPCTAAVEEARKACKAEGLDGRIQVVQTTWEAFYEQKFLPQFDLVLCFETIEHFTWEESIRLLDFLWASTEYGGRICLSTPDETGHWGKVNPEREHLQLFTPATFAEFIGSVLGKPDIELSERSGLILATLRRGG